MSSKLTGSVQKTVEVPQCEYLDRVVDVLVVLQRHSSMIQKVARTAEIHTVKLIPTDWQRSTKAFAACKLLSIFAIEA